MFFDDAKLVSHELDLTLTGRDYGGGERAPMCGVPLSPRLIHILQSWCQEAIRSRYASRWRDPATAKGLVRRDVVRIITPGTVIDSGMLDELRNNYIAALCLAPTAAGICFATFRPATSRRRSLIRAIRPI